MTLLVRDEIEIISANVDYHLKAGVAHLVVTDNGSKDGTREYLASRQEDGVVTVVDEPTHTHNQGAWVTRMARIAHDLQPDWIIHADADEFFWSEAGLKTFFSSIPSNYGTIRARRFNVLKDPQRNSGDFLQDNRLISSAVINPKICHRPSPSASVGEGNHRVVGVPGDVLEQPEGLTVWHFPYRSYEQYEKKIINGATAVQSNTSLSENTARHWRRAYEEYQRGDLRTSYNRQNVSLKGRPIALEKGSISEAYAFPRWCVENGIAS